MVSIRRHPIKHLIIAIIFAFTTQAYAAQTLPVSLAPIIEKVQDSIVHIDIEMDPTQATAQPDVLSNPELYDFFKRYFPDAFDDDPGHEDGDGHPGMKEQPDVAEFQPQRGFGSGVIISRNPTYIITNNHVVENTSKLTVSLHDGSMYEATIVGRDPLSDIAIITIDAGDKELSEINIGSSENLRVGDRVIAMGSPFGLAKTVTAGIVSGKNRRHLMSGEDGINMYANFIQTDASINPGNSGGALIDLDGNLVGINAMIFQLGGGSLGIGFAIPIDMAFSLASQLIIYGEVTRGLLGVSFIGITPEIAEEHGLDSRIGSLVTVVYPDSAASAMGLQVGDVIVRACGAEIIRGDDLRLEIGMHRPGATCTIVYSRAGKIRYGIATLGGELSDNAVILGILTEMEQELLELEQKYQSEQIPED